ncbi:MAG: hypothetical protein KF862_14230 [Chitinophagaceae bacterium]|nr:hypothetical protein [Chitinophagaceae bacterium]
MIRRQTIRSFYAWILALVLVFSITPKKFLHDLVADHKDDITTVAANDGQDHIDHHGFNCNCDNLVATSPFTENNDIIQFRTPATGIEYASAFSSAVKNPAHNFFSLRGPPALG